MVLDVTPEPVEREMYSGAAVHGSIVMMDTTAYGQAKISYLIVAGLFTMVILSILGV